MSNLEAPQIGEWCLAVVSVGVLFLILYLHLSHEIPNIIPAQETIQMPKKAKVAKPTAKTKAIAEALILIEEIENEAGELCPINYLTDAVGVLQICPIMVYEVNNIQDLPEDRYSLHDRRSRELSREMATVFLDHRYGVFGKYYGVAPVPARMAEMWYTGHTFKLSAAYRQKITQAKRRLAKKK